MIKWYEDKAFRIIMILAFWIMSIVFVSMAVKSEKLISTGYFESFQNAEKKELEDFAFERLELISSMSPEERKAYNFNNVNWYYLIIFNYGEKYSTSEHNIPYYENVDSCYMYDYIESGIRTENVYRIYINPEFEYGDDLYELHEKIEDMYNSRYIVMAATMVSGIILIIVAALVITSDKKTEKEVSKIIKLFSKISVDVLAAIVIGLIVTGTILTDGFNEVLFHSELKLLLMNWILIVACSSLLLILLRSAALQFREKGVFKSFLLYRIINRIVAGDAPGHNKTSLIIRTIGITVLFVLLEAMALFACVPLDDWSDDRMLLGVSIWLLIQVVILIIINCVIRSIKKLRVNAEKVIESNSSEVVQVEHFSGDLRVVAEALKHLDEGIQLAVDERVKSDRMKIELLTNVSHDLKTPLTSIINYVDLLSKESTTEEEKKEYVEILKTYSKRLKGLIDDLLEASKASTGNVELELSECNISILLAQAVGEFRDRAAANNVELVVDERGEVPIILADNQHMFRVFDNLLTNICKYSLQNSRAYLIINSMQDNVQIEFKNISKAALNISADELMERFVRGDESRSTEGNGLGLSIAKSLVELQNGTMDVDVNCDMFMVTLQFDRLQ